MSGAVESPLAHACTLLFVPGTRPERFAKALASGAGGVIIDWEDAVAPADKEQARAVTMAVLQTMPESERQRVSIRVNGAATPWHKEDLDALAQSGDLGAVVLPKAESGQALAEVARVAGQRVALLPLIESVAGLEALRELAQAPGVVRLLFGNLDFQADSGLACGPDEEELAPVRLQLVLASRSAGIAPPVDGVTADVRDLQRVRSDTARALRGGFGGKLCIHPAQVSAVHGIYRPAGERVAWAERIVRGYEASGGGVFALDGRMVDAPVVKLAQQLLTRARLLGPR